MWWVELNPHDLSLLKHNLVIFFFSSEDEVWDLEDSPTMPGRDLRA